MGPIKIFTVEDDPAYSKFLDYVLSLNPDFEVNHFSSGEEAIANLHLKPEVITLDYSLPDMDGDKVLKRIHEFDQNIHVIIISGQDKIKTAVELLKSGAYDYISKDEETQERLLNSIRNAREKVHLINEIDQLKEEISTKYEFEKTIIGSSPAIKQIFKLIEKAINSNITVSITGETGTGKEVVAKAIHYNSKLNKNPFVAVNIAAIPTDLIESELFGHEKGAFTGALARRIGKFEEAQGGTIFLDEIGELDQNLQAKLLRVLQEKELTRIGSNELISLTGRIIVATNRDLSLEVEKGNFREDLYYRLLGLPIHLPPLRSRGNDVILLAKHFMELYRQENDSQELSLSKSAADKLLQYGFPGNVRELKSIIDLAAVMVDGQSIEAEDLTFGKVKKSSDLMMKELTLKEYTNSIIKHFLEKYDNNVLLVAKKLDIGKSSIYRYIKEIEEDSTSN